MTPASKTVPSFGMLAILSAVAVVFIHISLVEGGVCWSRVNDEGRCTEVVQRGLVSHEECCRLTGALGAWTDEDYDSGQAFFWGALGGGAPDCKPCSTSCDAVKCRADHVCTLVHGSPRCGCPKHCPSVSTPEVPVTPVCSMEGITFRSECHMKKRNCRLQQIDSVSYEGYCQHSCDTVKCKDDQHCIVDSEHQPYCVRCMLNCPELYSPMCGTDGVTYDSMCHLNRAACQNPEKNIKYAHRGECKVSATCADVRCTGTEVCILDNKKNLPRCVRCDLNCTGSPLAIAGGPVCGSDGITYASWCQLRENSCSFGMLIQVERIGACLTPSSAEKARR